MAHFVFSAFSDESGETTLAGQIKACKANGITHMELRGFGKNRKRTWYSGKKLTGKDIMVIVAALVFAVVSLLITFSDGSRFYNPFV